MKKFLALTLTGLIAIGGSGLALAANALAETTPENPAVQEEENVSSPVLYLVPGTYKEGGNTVENAISSGADKLSAEECAAILTDNAYLCSLEKGEALPVPTSERKDKSGNPYKFNGWWTIVDATVTYYDKMPEITETTYLYADWRADLSQRKDPVIPDEGNVALPKHYMAVTRAKTGDVERLTLRVSGTEMVSAEDLGYGRAVQLYNGWFTLSPGDTISVYTAGLGEKDEILPMPLKVGTQQQIELEIGSDGTDTGKFLNYDLAGEVPTLTYKKSMTTHAFRVYIKFYASGSRMTVYMEQMD